jgi:hypothetical protein
MKVTRVRVRGGRGIQAAATLGAVTATVASSGLAVKV